MSFGPKGGPPNKFDQRRFNTEVNTGLRGHPPTQYEEARIFPDDKPAAKEPALVEAERVLGLSRVAPQRTTTDNQMAATPMFNGTYPKVNPDAVPLTEIYSRTAGDVPSHAVPAEQSGPNIVHGLPVPLYTYNQLERMSAHGPRVGIKLAANNLRDAVQQVMGPNAAPPLNIHAQHPEIMQWVLQVQLMLAKASGLNVTLENFGIPNSFDQSGRNHCNRPAVGQ